MGIPIGIHHRREEIVATGSAVCREGGGGVAPLAGARSPGAPYRRTGRTAQRTPALTDLPRPPIPQERGRVCTPPGCPLHSLGSRGVAPMTRGSAITIDHDPARASHRQPNLLSATPRWGCRKGGFLLGDPQGGEGVGTGLNTSVTASRMTDAYGASTLRVPPR